MAKLQHWARPKQWNRQFGDGRDNSSELDLAQNYFDERFWNSVKLGCMVDNSYGDWVMPGLAEVSVDRSNEVVQQAVYSYTKTAKKDNPNGLTKKGDAIGTGKQDDRPVVINPPDDQNSSFIIEKYSTNEDIEKGRSELTQSGTRAGVYTDTTQENPAKVEVKVNFFTAGHWEDWQLYLTKVFGVTDRVVRTYQITHPVLMAENVTRVALISRRTAAPTVANALFSVELTFTELKKTRVHEQITPNEGAPGSIKQSDTTGGITSSIPSTMVGGAPVTK